VFSRRIVGWALATHLRPDLPLDRSPEIAIRTRQHGVAGLGHHTDADTKYLAIRYAETLGAAGAAPSVGLLGDSSTTR